MSEHEDVACPGCGYIQCSCSPESLQKRIDELYAQFVENMEQFKSCKCDHSTCKPPVLCNGVLCHLCRRPYDHIFSR